MSKSITQDMRYRQSLMQYAAKYGVSRASRKYNKSWSYIYFWKTRWNGSVESLACQSRRPHHHPNQHTEAELNLIRNMRRRNPTLGMIELQIVDEKLFARANEVIDCRSKKLAQEKNIAAKTNNPTLLAGIVVCAHCGAKMSAFLHTDRYKLADGTIREKVQAKYNCYQRGQKLRACDGQSLYLAERVDAVVLEVVHDIFRRIQQEPYDRSIEQKLRQENGERERQKQAAEKKIKAAQYKQKRYEDEVIRCLDGQSRFSEEMLARLIAEAETEVRQAKEEYAELLRNDTTRATIQQIRSYYDEFLGWANEFDLATIPRKRAILGQLIEKVEVGKGYKVTVHLRMSYAQFLGIEGNGEIQVRKDVCA